VEGFLGYSGETGTECATIQEGGGAEDGYVSTGRHGFLAESSGFKQVFMEDYGGKEV
jgi:hypothetical protein